jgi:hypothetical protein
MSAFFRSARLPLGVLAVLALALLSANPSAGAGPALAVPVNSVPPKPDYPNLCAPAGVDDSTTCLRLTLAAIDAARAREHLGPMRIPVDFGQLTVPEQLLLVVNDERTDRGLVPFTGLTMTLDRLSLRGADGSRLPPDPGSGYGPVDAEWLGDVDNALDADYQWMYDDGPGSGLPGCSSSHRAACWVDRGIVLDRFGGAKDLVMGAALDPTGDTTPGDRGGTSLAAVLAAARRPAGPVVYSWVEATAEMEQGMLTPLSSLGPNVSDTGVPDPATNVAPEPDYFSICAQSGIDNSARCTEATLAALNRARALEGVAPMVLPPDYAQLTVPEQLFVVINLERIGRGLSPFAGLSAPLDANARAGAAAANDPPDLGGAYLLVDGEWAGGSVNALDAVYGWMYDDGPGSGNLDCPRAGAPGCWGHRHGILDDFGSGERLIAGAALEATADTHRGDRGGTSMAVTLAVAGRPQRLVFTWAEVLASMPPSIAPG